jgi:hypothetical protein
VISGRKGKDLVEMIALNPVLKLAGLVACVFADFKHSHDDDLYGNGFRLRDGEGGGSDETEEG